MNMPIEKLATPEEQCGRFVHTGLHVSNGGEDPFPLGCGGDRGLTPQELEGAIVVLAVEDAGVAVDVTHGDRYHQAGHPSRLEVNHSAVGAPPLHGGELQGDVPLLRDFYGQVAQLVPAPLVTVGVGISQLVGRVVQPRFVE